MSSQEIDKEIKYIVFNACLLGIIGIILFIIFIITNSTKIGLVLSGYLLSANIAICILKRFAKVLDKEDD